MGKNRRRSIKIKNGQQTSTGANPDLAKAMAERARSNAAGTHDSRERGTRDRGGAKRKAIAENSWDR